MKKEGIFKRIAGLTLAATMVFSLASCGGSADSGKSNAGSQSGAATSTAAGQIDTEASIAVGSTAQQFLGHFDICQLFSTECSTAAGYLLYDQLFSIGSDGKWYSDILKSYEWSTEAENQLVLTLKDNIYFSNGDQMTMEDVLYSMQRFAQSPRGATNFTVVDFDNSKISDDGMTLYLQYTQPYGPWQSGLNIFVMDKSFVEGLGDSPDWFSKDSVCGSGPYTVKESTTDVSITFERRDDWWMKDEADEGVASAKEITIYKYTDDTTMMADYMNGVIDVAINLTADDCDEIAADSSLGTYVPVSSNASAVIVLSPENEILKNDKIREAICLGTDGAASNNNLNMLEEMHLAAVIHNGFRRDTALMTARQVLDMATLNGARLQGRGDTGTIEVGKRADIMAIDLDSPHLFPRLDTAGLAVYSAQAADVCMTMVDGRVLYENGEYLTLDRERILWDAEAAAKRLYGA